MTRIARLNDGTQFPIRMCAASSGVLWLEVEGITMSSAWDVFSDPDKTAVITDTYDERDDLRKITWEGYTKPIHLHDFDDYVQVGLTKE